MYSYTMQVNVQDALNAYKSAHSVQLASIYHKSKSKIVGVRFRTQF